MHSETAICFFPNQLLFGIGSDFDRKDFHASKYLVLPDGICYNAITSTSIATFTMLANPQSPTLLPPGMLKSVHHVAFNVKDMQASRHFYGTILGLHELTGEEIPETLKELVIAGKVANFVTPDGTVIDLFWEPDLSPPAGDPRQQFTRANHLAFDIAPSHFEQAIAVLHHHQVPIDHGPVTRPTGQGIYFYDPDGFLLEIRCDPK